MSFVNSEKIALMLERFAAIEEERIQVDVPEPRTNRARFWKQMLIFIGAAGLLAL